MIFLRSLEITSNFQLHIIKNPNDLIIISCSYYMRFIDCIINYGDGNSNIKYT